MALCYVKLSVNSDEAWSKLLTMRLAHVLQEGAMMIGIGHTLTSDCGECANKTVFGLIDCFTMSRAVGGTCSFGIRLPNRHFIMTSLDMESCTC